MKEKEYIATFDSTHHALAFEKAANESGIKITIMPVPRCIAASCGLAVKFNQGTFESIKRLIKEKSLNYAMLYRIDNKEGKKVYIKL